MVLYLTLLELVTSFSIVDCSCDFVNLFFERLLVCRRRANKRQTQLCLLLLSTYAKNLFTQNQKVDSNEPLAKLLRNLGLGSSATCCFDNFEYQV